ncbi:MULTISPECIES: GFA family protein [unclassified Ruegeria]|uniref:GFA family protein n=1 Tax=unclassified Ruegeria TaxID=2625375 RepID=UPI001ADCC236|nr:MULTISPECIES: GFA family protein [unclassified Ruegeria]MBO9410457.1 GFA family protein [Ruegeria sp. R8_1]MBO9414324.1 GFA family protein [Ruegeria sp. R8_2]
MTQIQTSCSCGQTQVIVKAAPRVRFRCHCTKCQSVYQAPYADALLLRRGQARLADPSTIKWIHTKSPSPLSRGLCKSCGDPMLAYLFGALSVVPARTAQQMELPPVDCDIYYGTRVEDQLDDVPKYSGAVSTYLGLTLPLTRVLALPGREPTSS